MNYRDVYFSRVNHLGETTAERIRNGGIRSFEKWLAESPHTIRNLSVERNIYFDGIILTNKDKEHEKIMFLEVANNIPLLIGDIMNWTLDDGTIEKWILVQEEKKVNGTFKTFWIIRCNYLIKWIDAQGHLQQSWSYFVSSLDSKVKANFRTWNNLITPQPNKYAEILMPRYPIDRATNFIVEEESWTVVEYDHTSVPGVIYLSLTEGKINSIYDDVINNIADLDKKARYGFIVPEASPQIFNLGDNVEPVFTLMKNGTPYLTGENERALKASQIDYVIEDKTIIKKIDDELIGIRRGTTNVTAILKNDPTIQQTLTIQIGESEEQTAFSLYIEGKDKVRLDHEEKYVYNGTGNINDITCVYRLYEINIINEHIVSDLPVFEHPKLAGTYITIKENSFWVPTESSEDEELLNNYAAKYQLSSLGEAYFNKEKNSWVVHANNKNKLGYAILGCTYKINEEYKTSFKLIEVIPLW